MKLNNFPEYFPMFSRLLCLLLLTGTVAVSAPAQERYIEDTVLSLIHISEPTRPY